MIVHNFLRSDGFEVIEAVNGKDAVDAVRADSSIALVILDIMIPIMDGVEACKEIRKFSQVPIMIAAAKEDEEPEVSSFEIGADEFVAKPAKMRTFMSRVRADQTRRRAVSCWRSPESASI